MTLLYFAQGRELVGRAEETLQLAVSYPSGQALLDHLTRVARPALAPIAANLLLALNEEYVDLVAPLELPPGAVLALIPPLSGG